VIVTLDGKASTRATPVAASGPLFFTVAVNVMPDPGSTRNGIAVWLTATSAS
jgi:hypothetical protein